MEHYSRTRGRQSTRPTAHRQVYRAKNRRPQEKVRRSYAPMLVLLASVVALAVVFTAVQSLAGADTAGNDALAGGLTAPVDTRAIVVLDAGHGGHDNGATDNAETIFEAEITLDMAQRVGALLERHGEDVMVAYTRTDSATSMTPKQRAEYANSLGASLLLSLHINADESAAVRGVQIFAQTPRQGQNAQSLALADAVAGEIQTATGLPLIGSGVYYMFYRTEYDRQGYDRTWSIPEEELENDTFGVLQCAECPAVLAEMWYISNAQDMAAMYNDAGREAMAGALYRAVCGQLGLAPLA